MELGALYRRRDRRAPSRAASWLARSRRHWPPCAAPRLARPAAGQPSFSAVLFTDTAPIKPVTLVWRTGTDLAGGLLAVLDRLRLARTPPRPRPR
ncbi:hypothetical protein O1L55_02460 [Streptomyces albulus]|nr:hypothetical protein [Streptomyces noursei]